GPVHTSRKRGESAHDYLLRVRRGKGLIGPADGTCPACRLPRQSEARPTAAIFSRSPPGIRRTVTGQVPAGKLLRAVRRGGTVIGESGSGSPGDAPGHRLAESGRPRSAAHARSPWHKRTSARGLAYARAAPTILHPA